MPEKQDEFDKHLLNLVRSYWEDNNLPGTTIWDQDNEFIYGFTAVKHEKWNPIPLSRLWNMMGHDIILFPVEIRPEGTSLKTLRKVVTWIAYLSTN